MSNRKRFIICKLGLDAHDNGLRIVAKWLMDNGYEVIYAGLYNTPDRIVRMAVEEDADAIGISFLGGEHLHYAKELIDSLQGKEMGHVKIVLGGVIPPDDVMDLKTLGIDAVFTPGTTRKKILDDVQALFDQGPESRHVN
jgi:methylmalonyl-CoA mutase C-terminal domain/subunit